MENDDNLMSKIIFSNEATYNLNGKINMNNIIIESVRISIPPLRLNVTSQINKPFLQYQSVPCTNPLFFIYWPKLPRNAKQWNHSKSSC